MKGWRQIAPTVVSGLILSVLLTLLPIPLLNKLAWWVRLLILLALILIILLVVVAIRRSRKRRNRRKDESHRICASDEVRRKEIAEQAASKFTEWQRERYPDIAPTTDHFQKWIEAGGLSSYLDFDYETYELTVASLHGLGSKKVNLLMEGEFNIAMSIGEDDEGYGD